MMKIKVQKIGEGLHPSEAIVEVRTTDGSQKLVISTRSITKDGFLSIGFPIRQDGENYLVELPRETMSGSSRVWVDKSQMEYEPERKYA